MSASVAASFRAVLDVLFAMLWQDAIVAAVFALLTSLGRHSASTRCVLWQIALATMIMLPLGTTYLLVRDHHVHTWGVAFQARSAPRETPAAGAPDALRIDLILPDGVVLTIVACWLAGVAYRLARIGIAAMQLERLVRSSERLPDRNKIRVYASPRIDGPLTFGIRVPTIVVPAALSSAGGTELDHALAHEFAHIARADARATVAERFVHAFLYFNPAALVALRAITFEREASCDDRAIQATHDVAGYTRTLATLTLRNATARSPGLPVASSFAHSTPRRIARLLDAAHNGDVRLSLTTIGGFLAMSLSLALIFVTLAPAVAFDSPPSHERVVASTSCTSQAHVLNAHEPQVSNVTAHGPLRAEVKVHIAADGRVTGAMLYKTSGNAAFDADVVTAASSSTYAPQEVACKPVLSTYVFMAEFSP